MTDRPDIHTLTGAYALDALPDDEREVFEQHLVVCGTCAQEVAELQATASRLGAMCHETPPASLRDRVLAEIDATRQLRPDGDVDRPDTRARPTAPGDESVPAGTPAGDTRRSGRAARRGSGPSRDWVTGLSVAAAAVLVIAVGGLSVAVAELNDRLAQVETASAQVTDVLAAPDATIVSVAGPAGGMGRIVASSARGEAVFIADDMAPAPSGHTYELWLIEPDNVVKAGLFDTDERGRATRVMTGDFVSAAAVGVTVEPVGGSPQPTGDPVMVFELD